MINNLITVQDVNGEIYDVYKDSMTLDDYNNGIECAYYMCYATNECFVRICQHHIIDTLEERLHAASSPLYQIYSKVVDWDPKKNDSDGKIFKIFLELVKKHESLFFDDKGDYKHRVMLNSNIVPVTLEMFKEYIRLKQNFSKGGKKGSSNLTKAQRVERAKKASHARWNKN